MKNDPWDKLQEEWEDSTFNSFGEDDEELTHDMLLDYLADTMEEDDEDDN